MPAFRVDSLPPKKDGAHSMWRKPARVQQLKALRGAAAKAMGDDEAFDQPVAVRLRVFVPAPGGEPALWARRVHGDLDNFVTGICDGLQPAGVRAFDPGDWDDVSERIHPREAVCFTDDSWVRRIEAELCDAQDERVYYEVEVTRL